MGLGAAAVAAWPLLRRDAVGALLAAPPVFPGQVGDAIAYTTATGTPCWRFFAFAGAPADDFHYVQCIVPQSLDVAVPTPTVLVTHGATGTEASIIGEINPRTGVRKALPYVVDSWLDHGWPVVAGRQGSTITDTGRGRNGQWGSQASRLGIVDSWHWVQTAWTPHPNGFCVFGMSMGGAVALNFLLEAKTQAIPVAGAYSLDGVTNLAYCYTKNFSFAKQIRTVYGIVSPCVPGDEQWIAKVNVPDGGHDPQACSPSQFAPVPIRLAASGNDPSVHRIANSLLFFNTMTASGWPVEFSQLAYTGGHTAAKHFRPTDINPFFERALAIAPWPPITTTTEAPTTTAAPPPPTEAPTTTTEAPIPPI